MHKTITSTSWLVQDYWLMLKAHMRRQYKIKWQNSCVLYPLLTKPKFNASMNNSGLILVVQLHASVTRLNMIQKSEEMSLFQQFIWRTLMQITSSFIISIWEGTKHFRRYINSFWFACLWHWHDQKASHPAHGHY